VAMTASGRFDLNGCTGTLPALSFLRSSAEISSCMDPDLIELVATVSLFLAAPGFTARFRGAEWASIKSVVAAERD
jgi:hypothetical protein